MVFGFGLFPFIDDDIDFFNDDVSVKEKHVSDVIKVNKKRGRIDSDEDE